MRLRHVLPLVPGCCLAAVVAQEPIHRVSALGRLEPEHGVRRVGAPSMPEAISWSVLRSLVVEVGQDVAEGQRATMRRPAGSKPAQN